MVRKRNSKGKINSRNCKNGTRLCFTYEVNKTKIFIFNKSKNVTRIKEEILRDDYTGIRTKDIYIPNKNYVSFRCENIASAFKYH